MTECLGPNLKKLFLLLDKKFTIPTISMIAIQIVTLSLPTIRINDNMHNQKLYTIEYIHKHDYICCNIMPKEILISLNKQNQNMFITDFKQARSARSSLKIRGNVTKTANRSILNKFSSLNMHLGLRNFIH